MSHSVSYRFVRVSTAFEDLEGYALLRDYYGIEVNGELLVKEELGNTLYLVKVSELPDYSAEDNWFTIDGCRGLETAKCVDNSWNLFVDQIFDEARKELSFH